MKARFWVVCAKGPSLRDLLNDRLSRDRQRVGERARYPIRLKREHKIDRQDGWSSVRSRNGARGAVRYRWNRQLKILECWAVTRSGNRPSQLIGEFVETVLDAKPRRVKSIHVEVG